MSSTCIVVRATLSENLRLVSVSPSISMLFIQILHFNTSGIAAVNSFDDMGSPCLTPLSIIEFFRFLFFSSFCFCVYVLNDTNVKFIYSVSGGLEYYFMFNRIEGFLIIKGMRCIKGG